MPVVFFKQVHSALRRQMAVFGFLHPDGETRFAVAPVKVFVVLLDEFRD